MVDLYGIKNCDTVKKARKWLDNAGISYQFHDFRTEGIDTTQLSAWIRQLGWEQIVNKRSTTWKTLDESTKSQLNAETVTNVILDNPTLIKRPLLAIDQQYTVGFNAENYQTLFN